jgi:hypothetical protein
MININGKIIEEGSKSEKTSKNYSSQILFETDLPVLCFSPFELLQSQIPFGSSHQSFFTARLFITIYFNVSPEFGQLTEKKRFFWLICQEINIQAKILFPRFDTQNQLITLFSRKVTCEARNYSAVNHILLACMKRAVFCVHESNH